MILTEIFKKPLKIRAFQVFTIDLQTFLNIINTAYSLFTVMKSLKNKWNVNLQILNVVVLSSFWDIERKFTFVNSWDIVVKSFL